MARKSARPVNKLTDDRQGRTALAQQRFLEQFAVLGNVGRACVAAEVGRRTVYDWLEVDEAFRGRYNDALEDSTDLLEAEARRRAESGTLKPIYQSGKLVGHVQEFSDALMLALLKAKRPEQYKDRLSVDGKMRQEIRVSYDPAMDPDAA